MIKIFALIAIMFASLTNATHVCNSGWNTYAKITNNEFPIYGCDYTYNEVMNLAMKRQKCKLISTEELREMCYTTCSKFGSSGTCRGNGRYGFGAKVVVNCNNKNRTTHAVAGGIMRNAKIVSASVNFYDHEV